MKPCFHLTYCPADLLHHYSHKVHPDSIYDFSICDTTSLNHLYIVYHYTRPLEKLKEYIYVVLDTETNKVSQMCIKHHSVSSSQFSSLIPSLMFSLKYTGDRRYTGRV